MFGFRGQHFVNCELGIGVQGLGIGVWSVGFGVWGLGFGVYRSAAEVLAIARAAHLLDAAAWFGFGIGLDGGVHYL